MNAADPTNVPAAAAAGTNTHDTLRVERFRFPIYGREGRVVQVAAGIPTENRIVPPGGDDYAFTRTDYPVVVDVYVSPTGRSVQVHVNGERVYPRSAA